MDYHPLKIGSQSTQQTSTNSKLKNLTITGKHSLLLLSSQQAKSQVSIFVFSKVDIYFKAYCCASCSIYFICSQPSAPSAAGAAGAARTSILSPNIFLTLVQDRTSRMSTKLSEEKSGTSFSMQFATTMKQDIIQESSQIQMVIQEPNTILPLRKSSHIQQQIYCIQATQEMKVELSIR